MTVMDAVRPPYEGTALRDTLRPSRTTRRNGCRSAAPRRSVSIERAVALLSGGERIDPALYDRAAWCGLL